MKSETGAVGIISLGCPKNLVDSEYICELLASAGVRLEDDLDRADTVIVNTCAFLTAAVEESLQTILELIADGKRVICTGCLVSRYREALLMELPEVVLFAGPGTYDGLLAALSGGERLLLPRFDSVVGRSFVAGGSSAYVKISEGCSNHCSFCLIPSLRGELISKAPERILAECRNLIAGGVKELILIGQDLGAYGRDRGEQDALVRLAGQIADLPGLGWLRLMYVHPDSLNAALVDLMAGHEKICPYIDMPVQHISDRVLKMMGRPGGTKAVRRKIEMVRQAGIWLRSTAMVGHPGEDGQAFSELENLVAEGVFDHLGVFAFSPEEGTRSATYADSITAELKQERLERLMLIQQEVSGRRLEQLIGSTIRVLVEGYHPETELLLAGRAQFQAPQIDGVVIINEGGADAGEFCDVVVTETMEYDLVGRIE